AGLEMTEANLDLAVAGLQDLGKEFLENPLLILRKEERCHRYTAGFVDVVEADHVQAGAVDEERHAVQVAHADEVGAALDQRDKFFALGLGSPAVGDVD